MAPSNMLLSHTTFYSVAEVCGCRLDARLAGSGLSTRCAADRRAATAFSTSSALCAAVTASRRLAGSGLCPCKQACHCRCRSSSTDTRYNKLRCCLRRHNGLWAAGAAVGLHIA